MLKRFLFYSILCFSTASFAQETAKRTKHFNLEYGVAIQGYDPVSYFAKKPTKGKKELVYTQDGITYRFASQSNLEMFKSNPSKYEPAYGGWCAYAMGEKGEKVEVDPETFKIIDGKVYLFYNMYFTNTLPDWNKEESALKQKADASWIKLYK